MYNITPPLQRCPLTLPNPAVLDNRLIEALGRLGKKCAGLVYRPVCVQGYDRIIDMVAQRGEHGGVYTDQPRDAHGSCRMHSSMAKAGLHSLWRKNDGNAYPW